jgi:hypothetical protein
MWSALFTFVCLIYIVYSAARGYFDRKKKQNINQFLKKGIFCYKCKDLVTDNIMEVSKKLDIKEDNYHICTKCKRENKLSELLSKNFLSKISNKIKNLNWSDHKVFQFTWTIWGFGVSFLLIGLFSDYTFFNKISIILHSIQIYLMNRYFDSLYEDGDQTSEKINRFK